MAIFNGSAVAQSVLVVDHSEVRNLSVTVSRATENGRASRYGQQIARGHKGHGKDPGAPTAPAEGAAGETGATDTGVVPSGADYT